MLLLVTPLYITGELNGQNLPGQALGQPESFGSPYMGVENDGNLAYYNRFWTVYSDRADNYTYTTPGGFTRAKTLKYMEKFQVAEKQGEFIHIYKDPGNVNFPNFSLQAESYGWIHQDHLLLWGRCLVQKDNNIDRKAMILNTFEGTSMNLIEDQLVEYKKDPELQKSTGIKSRMFEILFVYKIQGNSVLLGQDVLIRGNYEDYSVMVRGWVPISKVTFWDHRFTLEPNWEQGAYRERQNKGIIPSVFSDARAALDYQKGGNVESKYIIWSNEPGARRNIGEWRRFPILTTNKNIVKAGVMGKIQGMENMEVERFAEIERSVSELEEKTRRINVVFVVDGTESMGRYYKPIIDGITESVNLLSEDTQNRFRFGAVIYRDKAEGENLFDLISLQQDHNKVNDFLAKARTDYSRDRDAPEAVYFGLKKALTSVGLKKNETNFIILVGDAGNHNRNDETRLSEEEIVKLASELECSLICFQANNGLHSTYDDFIMQSQSLVLKTANIVHQGKSDTKDKWRPDDMVYQQPFFESDGPNRYKLNDQDIEGSFLFPDKRKSLPYKLLQKEISERITSLDSRTSSIIQSGRLILRGHDLHETSQVEDHGEVGEFSEAVLGFLADIQGLTDEEINILRMRNYQFSMDGYSSTVVSGNIYPIFKEVLFLSADEMANVLANLQRLTIGVGSMNTKRQQMQNVWLDLLEAQLGALDRERVLSYNMDDINKIVNDGMPMQSDLIRNVRLQDITDPSVLSDVVFERYMNYLSDKIGTLRIFLTEGYEQSFFSNGIRYYWIPIEDFP